jgi:hypothetical protein
MSKGGVYLGHMDLDLFLRPLATLGTDGGVECVLEIGHRFAQAERVFLEGEMRCVVLIEAEPNAEHLRPRPQRIPPSLAYRPSPWQLCEWVLRLANDRRMPCRNMAIHLDALPHGLQGVASVRASVRPPAWDIRPNVMTPPHS